MPTFQTLPINQQTDAADEYGPHQEQPEYSEQVKTQENPYNDTDLKIFSNSYTLCMKYEERDNTPPRSPQPEQHYNPEEDDFNRRCSTPVSQIATYDQERDLPILDIHRKKARPELLHLDISRAKLHMELLSSKTAKAEGYLPNDASEGFASSVASSRSSSPNKQR